MLKRMRASGPFPLVAKGVMVSSEPATRSIRFPYEASTSSAGATASEREDEMDRRACFDLELRDRLVFRPASSGAVSGPVSEPSQHALAVRETAPEHERSRTGTDMFLPR